jgi:hypothetical protein
MAELQDVIVFEVLAELKACPTESDGIYAATPMGLKDCRRSTIRPSLLGLLLRHRERLRRLQPDTVETRFGDFPLRSSLGTRPLGAAGDEEICQSSVFVHYQVGNLSGTGTLVPVSQKIHLLAIYLSPCFTTQ